MPITPETIDKETKDYLMRIYRAMGFQITPIEFLQLYCYAYNELERMGDPDPKTNAIELIDSLDPSLSYSELKAELEGKLILREYPAVSEEMEELRKRVKELEEELARRRKYEYVDEIMSIKRQLEKIRSEIKKLKQVPSVTIDVRVIERRIQEEIKKLRDEIVNLKEEVCRIAKQPSPVVPFAPIFEQEQYQRIERILNDLNFILERMYGRVPDNLLRELGSIVQKTADIFEALKGLDESIMGMRYRLAYRDELRKLRNEWHDIVEIELYQTKYIDKGVRDLLIRLFDSLYGELMTL